MYKPESHHHKMNGSIATHLPSELPQKMNAVKQLETIVNMEKDYYESALQPRATSDILYSRKRAKSCDRDLHEPRRQSREFSPIVMARESPCVGPAYPRNYENQKHLESYQRSLERHKKSLERPPILPSESGKYSLARSVDFNPNGHVIDRSLSHGNYRSNVEDEADYAERIRAEMLMTSSVSNYRSDEEELAGRMDVESVRSGRSDRDSERGGHRQRSSYRRSRSRDKHRGERPRDMDGEEHVEDERIEVQILPQDDNWGDNQTQITTATSETGFSMVHDVAPVGKDFEDQIGFECSRYAGSIFSALLGIGAFLSPIAMVVIPKLGLRDAWPLDECTPECEGTLISFAFKLLILLIGSWALFARRPRANMPRVFIFRALVLFLIFVLTFAFWLFYAVRIIKDRMSSYYRIVQFSVSLVDALLFIHYLAIILLEIRQQQPMYVMKVVRSPDGECQFYNIGQLSIQRAAVWCLEQYMKDFQTYNPFLEAAPKRMERVPKMASNFKLYDVDGKPGAQMVDGQVKSRAVFAAAARRRDASHNDRFYEEEEYLRRVKKRKARLLVAAEEAFSHIRRMNGDNGTALPMDPHETAQAIFPSMARALQKYLRVTRQQPKYTVEGILAHLATCLGNDMSPKAFLEKYLTQGPCIQSERDLSRSQHWVLVCDQLLSRAIEHGTIFQLKQGEISLLCSVRRIPHFNIREEVVDPKLNKFVLRLQSETSV